MERLFVYGTLMKGQRAHDLLGNSKYLGKATHCIRHLSQFEKANIPIIAMSANAFEEDKKKAFDAKMNDYITKPIDFQKMEVVLKYILSKQNPLC